MPIICFVGPQAAVCAVNRAAALRAEGHAVVRYSMQRPFALGAGEVYGFSELQLFDLNMRDEKDPRYRATPAEIIRANYSRARQVFTNRGHSLVVSRFHDFMQKQDRTAYVLVDDVDAAEDVDAFLQYPETQMVVTRPVPLRRWQYTGRNAASFVSRWIGGVALVASMVVLFCLAMLTRDWDLRLDVAIFMVKLSFGVILVGAAADALAHWLKAKAADAYLVQHFELLARRRAEHEHDVVAQGSIDDFELLMPDKTKTF